jgi:outer membrane immunogenic protein
MLKRLIISGLTIIGSVSFLGMAQAADLPVKSSPYIAPAPVWSWTGFYIGGHVGAGWGTTSATLDASSLSPPAPPGFLSGSIPLTNISSSGFLGGVQLGYNYQVSPLFVVGIEGDFAWADINGDGPCTVFGGLSFSCKGTANWIGDITGRVGLAYDRLLLYVKGGWAWSDNDYDASGTLPIFGPGGVSISGSASETRSGGLLGFGIEYAFTQHWTAKIEYNYIDFGTDTITIPISITGVGGGISLNPSVAIDERINLVKVGANYKF